MTKLKKRHRVVALGGTFDHFHKGHQSFLNFAYDFADKLLIGVTSDKFSHQKKFSTSVQPMRTRIKAVVNFCDKNDIDHEIVVLDDPFGPTIDKDYKKVDALCVTKETMANGEKINEIRRASGMRELPIYIAPLVESDSGRIIHAQEIRAGEMNKKGQEYLKHFSSNVTINDKQRKFFSKPLGPILQEPIDQEQNIVAVVGDYALNEFIENNWHYDIGVFDKKTRRETKHYENLLDLKPNLTLSNPAGSITLEVFKEFSGLDLSRLNHIFIKGEEDLTTVALVLTLPLDSLVYYGQPGKGMVMLRLTEQLKDKVFHTLTSLK